MRLRLTWRFWERPWKSIQCAQCPHVGRDHRDISIEKKDPRTGHFDGYDTDASCKKCNCKEFYRHDMYSKVICKTCGINYFATSSGNPDGVAFCPNKHLDHPFDAYCPGPNGIHYTPEEWDRLYGDKE